MKKLFYFIFLIILSTNLNSAEKSQTGKEPASALNSKTIAIINEIKKSTEKHNKHLFKTNITELRELYPSPIDFTNILIPHINYIMTQDENNEHHHFYLQVLLENGFDINVEIKSSYNKRIYTIGNILLAYDYSASTYLEILSKYPMNPNAEEKIYNSLTNSLRVSRPALYIMIDLLYNKSNKEEMIAKIITLLLKLGADPALSAKKFGINKKITSISSPLYVAIENNAPLKILNLILDHKTDNPDYEKMKFYAVQIDDIGTKNERNLSALYASINHNFPKITKFLLEKGVDPEQGVKGKSNKVIVHPLTFAVKQKNIEIVELLVEHGANIKPRTNNGKAIITPNIAAFYNQQATIVKYLDDHQKKQKTTLKKPLEDKDLFALFKDFKAQYEDPQSKEKKGKKTLSKKQAKQQDDLKKEAKKIAAQRIKNIQEERDKEKEIIIFDHIKSEKQPALKQGSIGFKQRVIDWFKNPERAFYIQGYLETSPHPDPFKRALYVVEGPDNIIKYHRFPRAIDTSILYDDAYGEIKRQDGDTYSIVAPGHIIEDDMTITFGQFEYAFYEKENKTRIILHRFFRKLTPAELEGTFTKENGWSDIKNVASLPERDGSQGGAAAAAGPAETEGDNWQSEFEKEGWTYQDDEQTQSRIFIHPEKKEQYGIKKQSK
jgi:hypothetical protein